MSTLKNLEIMGRKTWLAGIGAYGTGWKYAIEKFDETYAKSNEILNELIGEGEKIERQIQEQVKAKMMIEARVAELKEKLGLAEMSEEDRIEQLSIKVDELTASVTALVKAKEAANKPVAKKAPAKAKPKAKPAAKKAVAEKS